MRRVRITMGLVVSLFAASGWPTIGASADSPQLEGTAWILSSLGDRTPPAGATATARFEGGRVQGTNGCNRYTAPVVIQGAKVEISPKAATTNMACPPDTMKLADAFMTALVSARSYRISAGDVLSAVAIARRNVLARHGHQQRERCGSQSRGWHQRHHELRDGRQGSGIGRVQQLHINVHASR
jgi:heat shock protein HslJ